MKINFIKYSICLLFILSIEVSMLNAQNDQLKYVYSSYFGGSEREWGTSITLDSSGYVYLGGNSFSIDLPVKSAYQSEIAGSSDAFITKLSPDMSEIIYCTYIGGSDYDAINNMVLDKDGNLYVVGVTTSSDFPYTNNAYDTVYRDNEDIFIIKMSPQGELLYSTYFGGSGVEEPGGLFIDDSLNIYITGFTNSRNFPVKSAFSDTYNGGNDEDFGGDAFVIKFNMADYLLIFSTYLGGANNELSCGITIDKENNVYVIGGTSSSDFPTKNGYDTIYGGNNDGFITKLSSTGKQIIYSSYFGGSNLDALSAVAVNDKNEAYFSGGSASSGLICSANVFYKNLMGEEDIVIGKVDASGSRLEYLSYFGGTKTDVGDRGVSKLHLNEDETIIIVGNTLSTDFPVTGNAFQKEYGGPGEWNYGDLFISKLDINKKENLYTTYFGGSNEEGFHLGIKCLTDSIVYIGSYTASGNFYTSSDALYKNYCGGTADACMIKMTLPKSKVSSISQTLSFKEIEIFPNPTTGQFRVSFNKTMTPKAIVEIYNSKGNQIFLQTFYFTLNATIDLSDFSDGIYLVKVIIDNMVYHQKVFKK